MRPGSKAHIRPGNRGRLQKRRDRVRIEGRDRTMRRVSPAAPPLLGALRFSLRLGLSHRCCSLLVQLCLAESQLGSLAFFLDGKRFWVPVGSVDNVSMRVQ